MTRIHPHQLRRHLTAGDHDALIRLLEPVVRSAINGLHAPGHDHDDLLQEARLNVLRGLRTFRGQAENLPAFAYRCANDGAAMHVRAALRYRHQPLTDSARDLPDRAPTGPADLAGRVADRDTLARWHERLTDLEAACASSTAQGLTRLEAAETLGVSSYAVANALRRARRKLRNADQEEAA